MKSTETRESAMDDKFEIGRRTFLGAGATGIAATVLAAGPASAATSGAGSPLPGSLAAAGAGSASTASWDVYSDTWPARDGLGRELPLNSEVGAPRPDRFVGIFYFTWLGQHTNSGPWNIPAILAAHPDARDNPDHPAWGPMYDYHHWSEPQFGYYQSTDQWVVRKHARQLVDAGVDVMILDATNGFDYANVYMPLLDTFAQIRAEGGATPFIAFLCPFDESKRLVQKLYADLYGPGLYSDLWFQWKGKPLVLSNPAFLEPKLLTTAGPSPTQLLPGHKAGFSIEIDSRVIELGIRCPTWATTTSGCLISVYRGGPGGALIESESFSNVQDNDTLTVKFASPQPAGRYYVEQSNAVGTIGWWSSSTSPGTRGQAYLDGAAVSGTREVYADLTVPPVNLTESPFEDPSHLLTGHTSGFRFDTVDAAYGVGISCPTWATTTAGCTISIYSGGPGGALLYSKAHTNIRDNGVIWIDFPTPLPPGTYYVEQSNPLGTVGWWSAPNGKWQPHTKGQAYRDGVAVAGSRSLQVHHASAPASACKDFFTFRDPNINYFDAPATPNKWAWLQDHPQHAFYNDEGVLEMVPVSVGQNILGGRIAAMSEPLSQGRSYHNSTPPADYSRTAEGLNFAEQWERALQLDPEFVFVTGWNEWVAMRLNNWPPAVGTVVFPDQFDTEHSRDIEPMKGGFGDAFYYQLASFTRTFKGARPLPSASAPTTIVIDGQFSEWASVGPEFRDHKSETLARNAAGWGAAGNYTNSTGRNEILVSKAARDSNNMFFYARTQAPLTPHTDPNWMLLLIRVVGRDAPSWEGFHYIVNRTFTAGGSSTLETSTGGWNWVPVTTVPLAVSGNELELSVPRTALGLGSSPLILDFKWIDNTQSPGDMLDLLANGDTAPNGRFRYRYAE